MSTWKSSTFPQSHTNKTSSSRAVFPKKTSGKSSNRTRKVSYPTAPLLKTSTKRYFRFHQLPILGSIPPTTPLCLASTLSFTPFSWNVTQSLTLLIRSQSFLISLKLPFSYKVLRMLSTLKMYWSSLRVSSKTKNSLKFSQRTWPSPKFWKKWSGSVTFLKAITRTNLTNFLTQCWIWRNST